MFNTFDDTIDFDHDPYADYDPTTAVHTVNDYQDYLQTLSSEELEAELGEVTHHEYDDGIPF